MTNVEKAEQYVEDVLSGKVLACRWVRLACERHRKDIERSKNGLWRWMYDTKKAESPCKLVSRLPHTKGKWAKNDEKLILEPWECFIICSVFGWVDRNTNLRRFREVFILVPRKNGKSLLSAGVGIYMLAFDGEQAAEIYCNATSEKQAWEVFTPAKVMVGKSPNLMAAKGIQVNASNIHIKDTGGKFEPVIGKPGDGSSPSMAIIDEYHEHQTSDAHDTMITGMGAREQPLLWVISTAGDNVSGPCYAKQISVQDMLQGAVEDDRTFGLIYGIDQEPTEYRLSGLDALRSMQHACHEQCVPTTQIEKWWEEAAALPAMTGLDGTTPPGGSAQIIQTESSGPKDCAGRATNDSCSITTQTGKLEPGPNKKSGLQITPTKSRHPNKDIETNQEQGRQSRTLEDRSCTGFLLQSTNEEPQNLAEDARYAEESKELFAWITTTAQEPREGYSASNATRQSAFSEITQKVYNAHSPTCCGRTGVLENGTLVIKRDSDDWTSPDALIKANPNYGVSVDGEFLQDRLAKAIISPRDQASFKTKHLNIWVNSRMSYFNTESWLRSPAAPPIEELAGRRCWIALDLASKVDIAALEMLFPLEKPGHYARYGKIYLPRSTVEDPKNAHYRQWRDEDLLDVTDGNIIDFSRIEEDVLGLLEQFRVLDVCYDPFQGTYLSTRLTERGANMIEYKNVVSTMSDPMKTLDSWIIDGKLHHNCGPSHPLTWQLGNVVSMTDRKDNVFPTKEREDKKIDSPVALIMCVGRATLDTNSVSPYESRGLMII